MSEPTVEVVEVLETPVVVVEVPEAIGPPGSPGSEGPQGEPGADGREVALRVTDTHVQWSLDGGGWADLIALVELEGPAGADGAPGADGQDGTDGLPGADGSDGREIALRVSSGQIQWQYVGQEAWTDLIALSALQGPAGQDGVDGEDGAPGTDGADGEPGADGLSAYEIAVQEGFVGDEATWLDSLVGPPGADGADGADGHDGAPGADGAPGLPGPTAVSEDAGNTAALGSDGLIYVPAPSGGLDATGQSQGAVPMADGEDGWDWEPLPEGTLPPVGDPGDVLTTVDGEWAAAPPTGGGSADLPPGGTTGQALVKASDADGDVSWGTAGGGGGLDDAGVAALVEDEESSTGAALRGTFVASDQVRRIIVTDNPDHPVGEGDMLMVLDPPRVIAAAWSSLTYGTSGTITSISAAVPLGVQPGDKIVVFVGSGYAVTIPGQTPVSFAAHPSAAFGRMTAYAWDAVGDEGGAGIQATQATASRMSMLIAVVRGPHGVEVLGHAETVTALTGNPRPHAIPTVPSASPGLVLVGSNCTLASVTGNNMISPVPPWEALSPISLPGAPGSHTTLRAWVLAAENRPGASLPDSVAHDGGGSHDGSTVGLLLVNA